MPGNLGQQLIFKEESISLNISKEGILEGGWKIPPAVPPIVAMLICCCIVVNYGVSYWGEY